MDGPHSPERDSKVSELKPDALASKRRKVTDKTVVRVRISENAGNLKNEGLPSDFFSWRKYGQKPIKGSPYPRGYYRCSTSKGCSAKKQVERCRTDASMLIISYTSSHNHPSPDLPKTNTNQRLNEQLQAQAQAQPTEDQHPTTPPKLEYPLKEEVKQDQPIMTICVEPASEGQNSDFHYLQSPLRSCENSMITQEDPFTENSGNAHQHEDRSILLDKDPISCTELVTFSVTLKSEENNFFDELEELPISSASTSFMRSNLLDEKIPVVPS